MNKILGFVLTGLLAAASLSAGCACGPAGTGWPSAMNVELGVGYREDKLKWSIAGFDDFPNILSEVQWKKLQMVEVNGYASYTSCRNYVVMVKGDYGYICSGSNTDADYAGDDRTGLWSLSHSNAGRGYVYDLSSAVGYRVTSTCGRFIGVPLIGYSFHSQHLRQFDGVQEFWYGDILEAEIEDLNSSYNTRWFGPWIGLEFAARVESCAFIYGGFEWHLASYRGTGNWNLRDDIGPFNDKAHGTGYVITLGGNWEIWTRWSLGLEGNFRYFRSRQGVSRTEVIFTDGLRLDSDTRFNGARWKSIDVLATLQWRW